MSGKHFVCQGAVCKCKFGSAPDKLVVLTQSKEYINDSKGQKKLLATHMDIGMPFEKKTFGPCSKMNNNPCTPAVTQWDGYYDKVVIKGNSGMPLLEDSQATCAVAGSPCIELLTHGQTATATPQNVANADPEIVEAINPLLDVQGKDKRISFSVK